MKTRGYVTTFIDPSRSKTITDTNIDTAKLSGFQSKHVGKVRDTYKCEDHIVIVATDRQSAFDRQLTSVPFKGQVLNLTSLWWFEQTKGLVPNHVLGCPHPNLTIGRKCSVFPVEFVMRGYITGSTSTRYNLMSKLVVRFLSRHLNLSTFLHSLVACGQIIIKEFEIIVGICWQTA